ncbi:N-acyl-phosphatidylethanolamine-hydrolyzing phospholipase D [Micractinium conductrix]|uniref:N-acyl-phosphatidylethanolamine-hydrolyzing phospholipase D n=1 Tax=Micractinium conductrix TaxID=554055 RepID=A0A2P6VJD8_9CHLO|nr:N-acyl-phosphatidylethanolamine-hydrolyzing phospholipase D [Micractinium conductrix]|eukprot:PSC74215.1 N-acyl-phosphatidylethanolamine-hydrolyzing phospholipase D [Micractinium conductrix]
MLTRAVGKPPGQRDEELVHTLSLEYRKRQLENLTAKEATWASRAAGFEQPAASECCAATVWVRQRVAASYRALHDYYIQHIRQVTEELAALDARRPAFIAVQPALHLDLPEALQQHPPRLDMCSKCADWIEQMERAEESCRQHLTSTLKLAASTPDDLAALKRPDDGHRHMSLDTHRLPNRLEALLPPHHRSTVTWWHGRFDNPWQAWEERSFAEVMRWNRERRKAGIPTDGYLEGNRNPTPANWEAAFPMQPVDWAALQAPPADAVQATWVGHSTLLVQLEGLNFLTDPVFSERCSPVQWMGPRRVRPPAFTAHDPRLPRIDAILLSHNHYDHLDSGSVKALNARFGEQLHWYVPLGLKTWFTKRGVRSVTELDWWQEAVHPGSAVRVALTPAMHWSMRSPLSRKDSLWGGWAVLGEKRRFWFAGDTGYSPELFPQIGERLGPFDLSAISTGAYEPRWFMKPQHTNPAEAVQIAQDVRSMRSVACHHATFCLTDEAMDEPSKLLPKEVAKAGLAADAFVSLRHGATIVAAGGATLNQPALLPVAR